MRTFAEKPKASQPAVAARSAMPGWTPSERDPSDVGLTAAVSPGLGHDFSRIPVHSPSTGALQTKPGSHQPGDHDEQEADAAADHVMRMPDASFQKAGIPVLQSASGSGHTVQRLAVAHGFVNSAQGGVPLASNLRQFMEPRLGGDFSRIQIHADRRAAVQAQFLAARAFTIGPHIHFNQGEYQPETAKGRHLLAHELAHTVQQGQSALRIQRSPLSDAVNAAWTAEPTLEALLARLSQADVQAAQTDTDVDQLIARLLTGRAGDLWVAERIRRGQLGRTTGTLGPRDPRGRSVQRSVEAFFFRGVTARRALVIAGVHGTERQGIEVARLLINDLRTRQPHFTVILVPSLFPDNEAARPADGELGSRESGSTPTNRNFPLPTEDLAAARTAGRGTPVDASVAGGRRQRTILPENIMLLELLERFQPERIISIHGTRRPGAAGVFFDPRSLSPAEIQAAQEWAAERAARQTPNRGVQFNEGGQEAQQAELQAIFFRQRVQELKNRALDTDSRLSLTAALQIDAATRAITGRERRRFGRENEDPAVTTAETPGRRAHPSIGGNVGPTGAIDHASWSGSGTGGISLGEYAPPRGMSVFTVEPPINRNISDYPMGLDSDVDRAERRIELQSYADAVRTVLLGAP